METKSIGRRILSLLMSVLLIAGMTTLPVGALDGTDDEYRALAYVTVPASENWRWIGTDGSGADDAVSGIDVRYVTHINFAFGMIDAYQYDPNNYGRPLQSGAVASKEAYKDPSDGQYHYKVTLQGWIEEMNNLVDGREYLRALVDLKKQKADLKVLLSIGGWDSDGFCYMSKTAAGRQEFIQSCIDIIYEYGLDGIDIDWEYPSNGGWGSIASCSTCVSDGCALLQEMRAAFDEEWPIEHKLVTIASGGEQNWINKATFDALDYVNVMCYDYSPGSGSAQAALSWGSSCMNNYANAFGDKKKLNLGTPFYNEGGATLVPYWKDVNYSGTVDCNEQLTKAKMDWVVNNGFGGAFYWNYSMDLFEDDITRLGLDSSQEKILQKTVYVNLNGEPSEPVGSDTSLLDMYWARSDSESISGSYTYSDVISALEITHADAELNSSIPASEILSLYGSTQKAGTVTYAEGYTFDGGFGGYEDDSVRYIQIGADPVSGNGAALANTITITGPKGNTCGWHSGPTVPTGFGSGVNSINITKSGRYIFSTATKIWWFSDGSTFTSGTNGNYIFIVDVSNDGAITVYDGSYSIGGGEATIQNTSYGNVTMNSNTSYTLSYSASQGGNVGTPLGGFSSNVDLSLDSECDGTLEKVVRSAQSRYPGTVASAEYTYLISNGSTPVSWTVVNSLTGNADNGNIVIFDSNTGKITANGTGTVVITGTDSGGRSDSVTITSNVSTYNGVYLTPDSKYSRYTSILGSDTEKGRWASFESNKVTRLSGFFYLAPADYARASSLTFATKQANQFFGGAGDYYIFVNGTPFIHASSETGRVSFAGFGNNLTISSGGTAEGGMSRYPHLNDMSVSLETYQAAFASLVKAGANQIDIIASNSQETAMVRPYVFASLSDIAVEAESITVTPDTATLTVGETITLAAAISPANAYSQITWTCNNNSIATVGTDGTVTAVAAGTAIITATTQNGKTDTCTITVEEPTAPNDVFVFEVNKSTAYWSTYDYTFTIDVPCQFVDGVTYVPFRVIAQAAGASSIDYDSTAPGIITIVNSLGVTYTLTMNSTQCAVSYNGSGFSGALNAAPQYIDGACCLPIRDVSNITGASVEFVEQDGAGYVIVSTNALTDTEIAGQISAAKENF